MLDNLPNKTFSRLLEAFSPNDEDAVAAYTKLRNALVRFFRIKGDYDPDEAADATLDRVQSKLSQETAIDNLSSYSFGVARFICLERIRVADKESIASAEFYSSREASAHGERPDDFSNMRECFDSLAANEQKLLKSYFADKPFSDLTERREKLAAQHGISTNSLRLRVFRLRQRLENCVRDKLA